MTTLADPPTTYDRLLSLLHDHQIQYMIIDHSPEGRTETASAIRGHPLPQAAKSMVIEVLVKRFALCVVPGDARVDLDAVRRLYGGTQAKVAPAEMAEELARSACGTIAPFSLVPGALDLIADPSLLEQERLYFNAARLDRSLVISADDYVRAAKPRLEHVATRPRSSAAGGPS